MHSTRWAATTPQLRRSPEHCWAQEDGADIVLVGDEPVLQEELDRLRCSLPIVHAPEVIEMGEDPTRAIREKKGASITVAARLVSDGEADGLVSAGHTGASVAAAALIIGRLKGVARPAIANIYPVPSGGIIVLDGGANVECKPEHLAQFAVMGSALAEVFLNRARPRVGLLNIGEEPGKGRPLEKEAYGLLEESTIIDFVGNIESRHIGEDLADVIVTDGFTGNVLLKTVEGTAGLINRVAGGVLLGQATPEEIAWLAPKLEQIRHRFDSETYGGAHLLGPKGVVIISHGHSLRVGIANSLGMAREALDQGLVEKVAAGLAG